MPPTDGPVLAQYKQFGGTILFATCPFGGSGGYIWQPPAKPLVTPAMVREQAERLVPSAAVGVAPKGTSLVNIETVLWADAPPTQNLAAVEILGQRVVISLRLHSVRWEFGDGEDDASGPAGKAYDEARDPCDERECSDYFGHEYRHTGRVTVEATATWTATFTVDGGKVQDAGAVPGPTATADIIIKQARGVLVANPDGSR